MSDCKHFCSCPAGQCPRHPANHDKGCDPCVRDNLKKGKMPACFFLAVHDDMEGVRDYSIESFADHFARHRDQHRSKFGK